MTRHLFAYGTLLAGAVPPEIAGVVRGLARVGAASVPGHLYDLGRYPGAVLDPAARTRVHGLLLRLPEDTGILASLDAYEGFDAGNPGESLFLRTTARATLSDGRRIECWVYAYNRRTVGARLVRGGRWLPTRPGRGRSSSRAPSRSGAPSR